MGDAQRVLITGATGFVGTALLKHLLQDKSNLVFGVTRQPELIFPEPAVSLHFNNLDDIAKDLESLRISVVVHCAARVHVMNEHSSDPLDEFRKVNVQSTLDLAKAAAASGVSRFVYLSSIKVNGESTERGTPFLADQVPKPSDAYGISKMEAEEALRSLGVDTGMEVVIIRPPLVYGPGVKANFLNMMRWLYKGIPLPFGSIDNRRSFVSIDNLVSLIGVCISHPRAANETFLVSDGEDVSTTDLLRRISLFLQVRAKLIPVPNWLLRSGATLLGQKNLSQRLCGSLQVDIDKTCRLLDWSPPYTVDQSLKITVEHFIEYQLK